MDGNKNTELSQIILRTRGRTLAIKKTQQQVEFDDSICVGFDDTLKQKRSF